MSRYIDMNDTSTDESKWWSSSWRNMNLNCELFRSLDRFDEKQNDMVPSFDKFQKVLQICLLFEFFSTIFFFTCQRFNFNFFDGKIITKRWHSKVTELIQPSLPNDGIPRSLSWYNLASGTSDSRDTNPCSTVTGFFRAFWHSSGSISQFCNFWFVHLNLLLESRWNPLRQWNPLG